MTRVTIIILDGVGAGALPDAAAFGDEGANTLLHVAETAGGLELPNLRRLGLGNILPLPGVEAVAAPQAAWGIVAEKSPGKDSTTGHWELAGLIRETPPDYYPGGFPDAVIEKFKKLTGLSPLGNKAASGTEIIKELGEEHLKTGRPIVYTSADSVFQVAAHKGVIPLEDLYRLCRIVREEIMTGSPHNVDRVIARPFEGIPGAFYRTPERKDFSLPPPGPTLLDTAKSEGVHVVGVGKIAQLFAGRGLSESHPTKSNRDGMEKTIELLEKECGDSKMLILVNLIEFDQNFGHRKDAPGFRAALEEFDRFLPDLLAPLGPDDLLVITADHGCDPVTPGTDHTREHVPLLAYRPGLKSPRNLGLRDTFADVAATAAGFLEIPAPPAGTGFLENLPAKHENSF